jgi:hypothetical protein
MSPPPTKKVTAADVASYIWSGFRLAIALSILPLLALLFLTCRPVFLVLLTALWPHNDIIKPRGLYLRRFYLTPRFKGRKRYFLHYIRLPDDDRYAHDHPWPFRTRILFGSYEEWVYFPRRYPPFEDGRDRTQPHLVRHARQGRVLDNPADHVHMVRLTKPVWTLVEAGPRCRNWGFWKIHPTDMYQDEWVDHKVYFNKGETTSSWKEDLQ